jgi:hypothetical protein
MAREKEERLPGVCLIGPWRVFSPLVCQKVLLKFPLKPTQCSLFNNPSSGASFAGKEKSFNSDH